MSKEKNKLIEHLLNKNWEEAAVLIESIPKRNLHPIMTFKLLVALLQSMPELTREKSKKLIHYLGGICNGAAMELLGKFFTAKENGTQLFYAQLMKVVDLSTKEISRIYQASSTELTTEEQLLKDMMRRILTSQLGMAPEDWIEFEDTEQLYLKKSPAGDLLQQIPNMKAILPSLMQATKEVYADHRLLPLRATSFFVNRFNFSGLTKQSPVLKLIELLLEHEAKQQSPSAYHLVIGYHAMVLFVARNQLMLFDLNNHNDLFFIGNTPVINHLNVRLSQEIAVFGPWMPIGMTRVIASPTNAAERAQACELYHQMGEIFSHQELPLWKPFVETIEPLGKRTDTVVAISLLRGGAPDLFDQITSRLQFRGLNRTQTNRFHTELMIANPKDICRQNSSIIDSRLLVVYTTLIALVIFSVLAAVRNFRHHPHAQKTDRDNKQTQTKQHLQ